MSIKVIGFTKDKCLRGGILRANVEESFTERCQIKLRLSFPAGGDAI
jgi:hypothetical protein